VRRSEQRRRAVFALYQHDLTGRALADLFEREDPPFTRELAEGALERAASLDELIGGHAHGWDVERIAPLERSVLRIGAYELTGREDVPAEVAIDEAVELAKKYCGPDAPGFVNGILGSIRRESDAEQARDADDH
jgi:N utilization substance protein B